MIEQIIDGDGPVHAFFRKASCATAGIAHAILLQTVRIVSEEG
jgi:hypothetical protein